jgi:tRNA (guanosine-2'-O-)-methyltransferase
MDEDKRQEITEHLATYITEHKKDLMEEVLAKRTRFITVVLEDIYQSQNASAVVRTADCFGVQDVHVIEGRNVYDPNPQVLQGSGKWVDVIKHAGGGDNTEACFSKLKQDGYRIIGTTPHREGISLPDFEVNQPTALVFGTEETGLSEYAMEHVDDYLCIPMYGFTESFNLSVSAAICLSQLTSSLYSSDLNWGLSEDSKTSLRLAWYKKVVRRSDAIIHEYLSSESH